MFLPRLFYCIAGSADPALYQDVRCIYIYTHAYAAASHRCPRDNLRSGMHSAVTAPRRTSTWLKYSYICIFLLQLFILIACGSYINTVIVCVSWTVVLLSVNEHNVVICVLCAISIVLQMYALSINSQRVLLVSSPRQRACETIGISHIDRATQTPLCLLFPSAHTRWKTTQRSNSCTAEITTSIGSTPCALRVATR